MKLIALLVLVALAALVLWFLMNKSAKLAKLAGKISGGGGKINQVVATWVTAPASIQVGQTATFTLHVQNSNPSAIVAPQLTNIVGRHYSFTVGPQANISIVSVSPAASGPPNTASTNGSGQITVVVKANSLPSPAEGALIGISPADTSVNVETIFEVTPSNP